MSTYRIDLQLSWETNENINQNIIRSRLDRVINKDYCKKLEKFDVKLNIQTKNKNRNNDIFVKKYDYTAIFPFIGQKKIFTVHGKKYKVNLDNDKFDLFLANRNCVFCGLEGRFMVLETDSKRQNPHFNLYGEEDNKLILMNKDHIIPKSKHGPNLLQNYQTTCAVCNSIKGNVDLSVEQLLLLRKIYNNDYMLSKKETMTLINRIRDEFSTNSQ